GFELSIVPAEHFGSRGLALKIAGNLVVGADRGDQVTSRVLADTFICIAQQPVENFDLRTDTARRMIIDEFLRGLARDPACLQRLDKLRGLTCALGSRILGLGSRTTTPNKHDPPATSPNV